MHRRSLRSYVSFTQILCALDSCTSFPSAVGTKYHKLCSLNQHKFLDLEFWRSEVCNGFYQAKITGRGALPFFFKL